MDYSLLICFVIFIGVNSGNVDDVANHECSRPCSWPPQPKTCLYTFTVEWLQSMSSACYDCPFNLTDCQRPGCIPVNGVSRPIVVINRQLPGPPIQVCEGDDIKVKVWNRLGNSEGTSIHWHGIHQRGTPYMDGAVMVTQCPISAQASFTYKFKASPAGTHWWHSHSNVQRQDGAYGAFIVKQAPERDVNSCLYDYDLPEHVILVQEWTHEPTISYFAELPPNANGAESLIINGKGQFQPFVNGNKTIFTPREVFRVKQGQRYRFRVIGNNGCHMSVEVENHRLAAIASDGSPMKQVVVDRIGISSGERYDFVLTANQSVDNYWFRLTNTDGGCQLSKEEFAIIRYDGAPEEEPKEIFAVKNENGIYLNPRSILETPDGIDVLDAEAADETVAEDVKLLGEPDLRYYMAVGFRKVSKWNVYDEMDYPNPSVSDFKRNTRQLNYVSFKVPPSPLLTQFKDIPEKELCIADEIPIAREECVEDYCNCIQIVKIPLGKVVEIVVVSEDIFGADHPMHIHGYSFRVVGYGKLARGTSLADVVQLDKQGNITRQLDNALLKDSFQVQGDGYTIIRFVADNPGWWFFHCHKIFHVADGMSIVLQVGEQSDLPPIPDNFPRCGSWTPTDDEPEYDKHRKNGGATVPSTGKKSRKTNAE